MFDRAVPVLAALMALVPAAWAESLSGRVVAIADGDTLAILDARKQPHRIRLAGIDAPEKKQPFGQRSKAALSTLVFDKDVVAECDKHDRYRRLVCKIMLDGKDINLEQLRAGMAWWYRKYAQEQSEADQVTYEAAEQEARSRRLGLWIDENPTPPWEFRHPQ